MAEIRDSRLWFSGEGVEDLRSTPTGEIVPGRGHRVVINIESMSRGSVAVWVGGRRTDFFTAPGVHVAFVTAGDTKELRIIGIRTDAVVDDLSVRPMLPRDPQASPAPILAECS